MTGDLCVCRHDAMSHINVPSRGQIHLINRDRPTLDDLASPGSCRICGCVEYDWAGAPEGNIECVTA